MTSVMHMFRKRSMQKPTPYITNRIAFLDPWFVSKWAEDYHVFASSKTWEIPEKYFDMCAGKSPKYLKTFQKWVDDVDILYLTHNIDNAHWVALEVDLLKRRIKVYDSILSPADKDADVFNSCKPYTRMIPHLLYALAPDDDKPKMGCLAFSIYRLRSTPQNLQVGDCGVYALKYIECLALGITFDGLNDGAMPELRLKLGAEVFDEVPDSDCFLQMLDRSTYSTPEGSDSGQVQFLGQTKK